MAKTKFVVFGAGRMGLFYIRLLLNNSDVDLGYIVVKSHETRKKLLSTLNLSNTCQIFVVGDEGIVFDDSSVNAAIICSPTHAHEEQVKKCLRSGFSVYCEKPISFSAKAIEECYDLARSNNLHLYCAFQRRFDASFKKVYESVRSGSLGKLHFIKSCSRDGGLPDVSYLKTSGGFFKDSTVHDIDMICWIAGELPVSVFAQGHAHQAEIAEINDYDSVTVVLKFSSGLIGIIDQDRYAAYGYDQRLEVLGENGMIQVENPLVTNCQTFTSDGKILSRNVDGFLVRYENAYRTQLENFMNLVKGEIGSVIQGGHVLAVEKIAEAASLSSKTNKVIEMNYY